LSPPPPSEEGTIAFIDTAQNILYPGRSFRFQESDSPVAFTKIILNNSHATTGGTVTLSATDILIDQGSVFNLDTPGRVFLNAPNVRINGSSTLLMSGNETVTSAEILLTNSATLSHVPDGKISLNIPAITIDPTSTISADGKGYAAGPGSGRANSGGGYGGHGSAGYACCSGDPSAFDSGGVTYGSTLQPTDLGSGTGSTRGGGAIRLIVTGKLTIEGNITANGETGGSGGSIYITAHSLEGSGKLAANGGNFIYQYAGGGGGGRIAVYFVGSTYSGSSEVQGGSGYWGPAQEGTIVFTDTAQNILYPGPSFRFEESDSPFTFNKIILNHSRSTVNGSVLLSTTDLVIDLGSELNLGTTGSISLVATTVHINGSSTLFLGGNETVSSNAFILTQYATLSHVPGGKIYLTIPTLTIDPTSAVSADGKGYGGDGPGSGRVNSGGGYGGHGAPGLACCSGDPSSWDGGGSVYGSALQPTDLGSGDGTARGGGAIRLIVTDSLTINGKVTANGDPEGSGGSIFITAQTLDGSGNLAANGGNYNYQYAGGGGGGRIAAYYTTSAFSGTAEAKGGSGYWGPAGDGTVIISGLTSNSPVSLVPLAQVTFTNSTNSETITVKSANVNSATVQGNISGSMDITDLRFVTVTTGAFRDEGFVLGNWNATLEGVNYKGTLEGEVFFSGPDNTTYLKGTTSGQIIGIVEGELTESVPESGIFDILYATWQMDQVNSQSTTGTLLINGSITSQGSTDYPGTGIYAIQTMIEGTASGHYTGPLSTVLTHVRIADPESAYDGYGFSVISYTSREGSGKGWTFDRQKGKGITEMHGLLSSPIYGLMGGTLDETKSPLKLFLSIERMDLGIPVMADLEVIQPKTLTISPGQTWDYTITIRNNGLAPAENVVVVDSLPARVTYINSSQGGIYKWDTHEVIWKLGTLDAKTSKTVSVKVTSQWGMPIGTTLNNIVMVGTTSPEKDVYLNPAEGLYNLQEYLDYQPTRIISSKYVTPSEFNDTLIADPSLFDLYNFIVGGGYHDTHVTGVITFSDGSQITQHYMESTKGDEVAILTKEVNSAQPEKNGATIIGINKAGDLSVYNREGKVTISDTGTTVEGNPSPYTCRYVDRLRNCLAEALPGIAMDVASEAAAPGVQSIRKVAKGFWDGAWMAVDCIACRNGLDEYCEGCFQKSAATYQNLIDAPPIIGDLTWCGVRATDPSAYSCTYCTYTSRCPSKWNIFAFPNSLITTHCTQDCRIADASDEYGPSDPRYRPFRLCDREIPGGKCQMVGEGEAQCIDPRNTVDQPTYIWVARDPNIKFGPEGHVLAGQTLDYRIEYENVGEGIAFGVYFIDTLDEDLDASSLTIGPVYSTVDNSQIAPAGRYNPGTRTITWLPGEVGSHEGGYSNISVKVRRDAPDDTEIINYGIVYFPSVPEETRTNAIVSVVGINHPPSIPANPTPSNNDTNVTNTTSLLWTTNDPDSDTLRYDVYFGNTTPLPILERDTFSTIANPGNLAEATTYSWQVIARDPDGAETPGPVWIFSTKSAQPSVIPLPGITNPPTDPDGDGLYEDLNANNRKDFNDVVLMFNQMQWIAANEPVSAFDFNGNGRVDFNDIVKLFGEI
jgi:uncharacterized repeat protein (TIGR01451 family)